MLSENLTGEHLTKLLQAVSVAASGDCDGVIVTHGTDTLQYSSAALGYAFAGCQKPIVVVSSNFPLGDARANGQVNFDAAVAFIRQNISGVFVSYRNTGERAVGIHRATRLMRHREYDDKLFSLGGRFGEVADGRFTRNPDYADGRFTRNPDYAAEADSPAALKALPDLTKARVLRLDCSPGMLYPDSLAGCSAALLISYHSGTVRTVGTDFGRFCKAAASEGKPIFLVGAMPGSQYESTNAFADAGITRLPRISATAAYMKLWLLCAAGFEKDALKAAALNPLGCDTVRIKEV